MMTIFRYSLCKITQTTVMYTRWFHGLDMCRAVQSLVQLSFYCKSSSYISCNCLFPKPCTLHNFHCMHVNLYKIDLSSKLEENMIRVWTYLIFLRASCPVVLNLPVKLAPLVPNGSLQPVLHSQAIVASYVCWGAPVYGSSNVDGFQCWWLFALLFMVAKVGVFWVCFVTCLTVLIKWYCNDSWRRALQHMLSTANRGRDRIQLSPGPFILIPKYQSQTGTKSSNYQVK